MQDCDDADLGRPRSAGSGQVLPADGGQSWTKNAPVNTLGIRRIMFAVDDIEDVLARLRAHGAELIGEVAQYEDLYRLCYIRGSEGIIVALAEQFG